MAQVTESDYEIARRGTTKARDRFTKLAFERDVGTMPFIEGIGYREGFPISGPGMSVSYKHDQNKIYSTKINVFPKAFAKWSFERFVNTLNVHENLHMTQALRREMVILEIGRRQLISYYDEGNKDIESICSWSSIKELPAYAQQLMEPQDMGEEDMATVNSRYQRELKRFQFPKNLIERKGFLKRILLGTPGDELIWRDVLS